MRIRKKDYLLHAVVYTFLSTKAGDDAVWCKFGKGFATEGVRLWFLLYGVYGS
jgi:hypothetical protein